MNIQRHSYESENLTFQKFIKINGRYNDLDRFRMNLKKNTSKPFVEYILKNNSSGKDSSLYIFSGKDFDKLIKIMKSKLSFFSIRSDIENAMEKQPKILKLRKAINKLKKKKFDL